MEDIQIILNKIYTDVKKINKKINHSTNIKEFDDIFNIIDNYENQLHILTKTISQIHNLKNNLKMIYKNKLSNIKTNINSLHNESLNISYNKLDCLLSNNLSLDKLNTNNYNIEFKNITNLDRFNSHSYTKCPVISINEDQISEIINSPIYYIKDTKEYCMKINNKIIRGNIGNIYNNPKESKKIRQCKKVCCNNKFYQNKECNFYHKDYNEQRNFTNYSWNHITKNKLGKIKIKNKNINYEQYDLENSRFIGSLNSLQEDLIFTNGFEKELRNKQLMHDILLYQILDQYLN